MNDQNKSNKDYKNELLTYYNNTVKAYINNADKYYDRIINSRRYMSLLSRLIKNVAKGTLSEIPPILRAIFGVMLNPLMLIFVAYDLSKFIMRTSVSSVFRIVKAVFLNKKNINVETKAQFKEKQIKAHALNKVASDVDKFKNDYIHNEKQITGLKDQQRVLEEAKNKLNEKRLLNPEQKNRLEKLEEKIEKNNKDIVLRNDFKDQFTELIPIAEKKLLELDKKVNDLDSKIRTNKTNPDEEEWTKNASEILLNAKYIKPEGCDVDEIVATSKENAKSLKKVNDIPDFADFNVTRNQRRSENSSISTDKGLNRSSRRLSQASSTPRI